MTSKVQSCRTIYTITFQSALNNGAILQAYALVRYLRESGYETQVINYVPWRSFWERYRPTKSIRGSVEKIRKIKAFDRFVSEHLPMTRRVYRNIDDLRRIVDAHAVVCGSDQIWNPSLTGGDLDPAFFGGFAPTGTRRISYAASAGSVRLSAWAETTRPLLKDLSFVGVRESTLVKDIHSILPDLDPKLVLDPSFLISDYNEIACDARVPKCEYILSYVVGSGEMLERFNASVAALKQILGLPVIHIGAKPIACADQIISAVGPSEWLGFISASSYVITNSFHATAFSLIFEKQFMFVPHVLEHLNSRQETILAPLGLMRRRVSNLRDIENVSGETVEYNEVTPILKGIIKQSRELLLEALL